MFPFAGPHMAGGDIMRASFPIRHIALRRVLYPPRACRCDILRGSAPGGLS